MRTTALEAPIVSVVDLHRSFPAPRRGDAPVPVLRGITLSVSAGEFVAIVGQSGSGKSTLLYCMAGLESADAGTVTLHGSDVARLSRNRLARLRRDAVGFVFQSFNLIPELSARENVALPARLARGAVDREAVDGALAAVGLADRASHRPGELSGGQQQRVAIARVLAARPPVVFADEPTGSLDSSAGAAALDLLAGVARLGSALVLVTHDLVSAARADRVIVLRDGAVHGEILRPTPETVFAAVHHAEIGVGGVA